MASNLMIDDRLKIDHFNPTTWTGDYGINRNGFRQDLFIDGSYTNGIDETLMAVNDVLPIIDIAGNTYLKTAAPSVAPYTLFPARKFEYSNGRITWVRPLQPWSWQTGESVGGAGAGSRIPKDSKLILILLIIVILVYCFGRLKIKS